MAPQILKNNIAYIRIPTVWALTKEEIHKKVLEIQNAICGLHYTSETNWIIDFRLNNGGQFRSMLAAIGNLIGNGTSLYFVSNDGKAGEQWILRRDGLYSDSTLATSRSQSCDVINYHPKIAILIGSGTSSAAEDVVAAFKGRKNTRFFGEETKGLVTVNSTITLDENTFFSLITGNIKDRNGKIYTDSIKPDVVINEEDDFGDIESDPKVLAASKWLQSGL